MKLQFIHRISLGLVTALIGSVLVAAGGISPAAAAPATLTESFTDATMVSPEDWYLSYTGVKPCLTGITSSQSITLSNTTISGCSGTADPAGQGALLLSRNTNNNAATMLYNKELSTAAGLDVQFFQSQYGGSGADGISFFTKLGTQTDLTVGLPGGGLGYLGVKDGLFGVGFDDWLNWTRWDLTLAPGEQLGGMYCPGHVNEIDGYMNSLGIRGPDISAAHDGSSGFCRLNSVQLGESYFGGSSATRSSAARPVRIIVDPSIATTPKIRVFVWASGGLGQDPATASVTLEADQPQQYKDAKTFKFGFAASTGSVTNNHAIWGLAIAPKDAVQATTYYAVPQSQTIQKGATPTYTLKYYKDAAHTQEFTPGGLVAPTCTSPYVPASSAAGTYTITCTGGSITLANLQIDGTGTLTVTRPAATLSPAVQNITLYRGEPIPPLAPWVASNFEGTVSYSCTAIPQGTNCGGPNGLFAGTPTQLGSGSITVSASDGGAAPGQQPVANPQSATAVINYTIVERTSWNYTVNYDANGGTGTMAPQTGTGSSVTLTNNTFTRAGYTFTGWKTDSGTAYTDGQSVPMTGALTLTLKAQWKQDPTLTPATQTIAGKVNTAITTTAFTTTGFTGTVKYTVSPALPSPLTINANTGVVSGTPTTVLQSTAYTVTAADGVDTKTATINLSVGSQTDWTYLVEYGANGGTGTMARQTGTAASVKLTKNTFTRTGYTFSGWKDKYAGGTYTDEQVVQLTKSGDFLMEAQWTQVLVPTITPASQVIQGIAGKALTPSRAYSAVNFSGPVTYTISPALPASVTIDANTGVISGTPAAEMTTVNYVVKATSGTESATAMVDLFVTKDTTGGGNNGGGGGSDGNNNGGGGAIAYAISFDPNGGNGTMAGITGAGATTITLPKNTFTSGVMKWVKWQDDAGVYYTDGQSIQITKTTSLVLHAQWEMNEANVGSFTKPAPVRPGATQPVSFARNSNALSTISNKVLAKWNLKTVAAITIAGYVEPAGSSANDYPLSLKRAKAVAGVMAKKYKGIRIKTIGMGRQLAKKCRPFKNKCAYITIMVMKDGRTVKSG